MDPVRSKFGNLKKEEIDLSGTMRFVQKYMRKRKSCLFSEILSLRPGKLYKIVTFLTLLQLMKEGKVEVTQEETFADIQIDWTGPEEDGEEMDLAQEYGVMSIPTLIAFKGGKAVKQSVGFQPKNMLENMIDGLL